MNFKTVSTFLLIILVGILIGTLIRYYNTPIRVTSNIDTNSYTNHQEPSVSVNDNKSGDKINNKEELVDGSGDIKTNVDNTTDNSTDNNNEIANTPVVEKKPPETLKNDNDKNNQVIITSEDTMTNKEKREILTELDNTLMELLDVVDKVQIVDETRLITDESEVQR